MKKGKIVFCGMISLIVFGLLIPQPLQAVLVLINSPIKDYFAAHSLGLCIIVGVIQGFCEEGGYYLIFRTLLRKETGSQIPVLFGLGRSGLELLYNVISILGTSVSITNAILPLVSRVFAFGSTIGLTMLDYSAYWQKRWRYLILSILLHAIINSTIYAGEVALIKVGNNFEAWFMIAVSLIVIPLSVLLYKKQNLQKTK